LSVATASPVTDAVSVSPMSRSVTVKVPVNGRDACACASAISETGRRTRRSGDDRRVIGAGDRDGHGWLPDIAVAVMTCAV